MRRLLRPATGGATPTLSGLMRSSIPYGIALGLGGLLALALEAGGFISVAIV